MCKSFPVCRPIARLPPSSSDQAILSSARLSDRNLIFQLIKEATSIAQGGSPGDCLQAALSWVDLTIQWSDLSSIEAYCKSLELLQIVLAAGSSLESRHLNLISIALDETRNLAVNGAACAIKLGNLELALEMLEQGRSLLMTQAGRYRTPVDDLEDTLAHEFRAISAKMNASVMGTRLQAADEASDQTTEDAVAV